MKNQGEKCRKEESWAMTAYLYRYDMDGAAESTAKQTQTVGKAEIQAVVEE